MYHNPVLLNESIEGLNIVPSGTYVDVTYGGGGHSKAILDRLASDGRLIAFDQDTDALSNALQDQRFTLVNHNFTYLQNFLELYNAMPADGILADLGVSSHQFDAAERGFSTRFNAPMDMRMNQGQSHTAEAVVNEYDETDLIRIFRDFGELKNAYQITKGIIKRRQESRIVTTQDLVSAVTGYFPPHKLNKYLAMVFQALRIEVNDEMNVLKSLLEVSTKSLRPGGRLVVISYHSLEDRLVKNFIRAGNFTGEVAKDFYGNAIVDLKSITRKPIIPTSEEINTNPRARSAKLRIAEKR